ncbi:DUF4406 domain-containing protein [Adlercreutzia caecimuris]|uniref:DUF4406 domain-containing protein n=1 Tax=Adlercreutzia caecimuris B7 TaxID=1235794 RepID=R9KXK8_9ACTN|nr:DUF4406 domain-containing protein [Adlercreutzia caecimuris]EOS50946.1 hypothetical protein C811_01363 [Adlercreutzia caecimuris B7]NBJ66135.1 DUF4406 domain-containing protein [Adlercreutzia caecimuris]
MSRLYVSGPVTGRDNRNLDAFQSAQRALVDAGHTAIIPHQIVPLSATHEKAMRACINDLTWWMGGFAYDGVALLEGWEASDGACLERAVAVACGIPCKTVGEWLEEVRDDRGDGAVAPQLLPS